MSFNKFSANIQESLSLSPSLTSTSLFFSISSHYSSYSVTYSGLNNYNFIIVENGEEPQDYYYEKANVLIGVKDKKIVYLEIELLNPDEKLVRVLRDGKIKK